jgi:sulfhydrogenase subunit beta (sulfur reductase)
MIGDLISRPSDFVVPRRSFLHWLDALRREFVVSGPVTEGGNTSFKDISAADELDFSYASTMLPPGKLYLYKPVQDMFRISLTGEGEISEIAPDPAIRVLVGVHACDTHAILYLDKTFLGAFRDPYYETRRKNTLIISLNCSSVGPNCFCSSMGAGPFLGIKNGYDMLITDMEDDVLVEIRTERIRKLFSGPEAREAKPDDFRRKEEKEKSLRAKFTKEIRTEGLSGLLTGNPDHPVWRRTAQDLCLSCSNCVMVCPTCFCYDVVDEIAMDMKSVRRFRQWDACQDAKFAEVHGGNFRSRRAARLRQFVTHKLDQTHQYGVFGTVGCGRCITWCPTGIDLTDMAKEVQRSESA